MLQLNAPSAVHSDIQVSCTQAYNLSIWICSTDYFSFGKGSKKSDAV